MHSNYRNIHLLASMLFISVCYSQNCNKLELSSKSFTEAVRGVRETNFKLFEQVDTKKSSWIKSLEYYSCDGAIGYLVMTTKKDRNYIHKGVPVDLWYRFKRASSFGKFYNLNIKGKYQY